MPLAARWMIRCSLVYLLLGITIGSAIFIHKAFSINPILWQFLPVHTEILIFGWIIQFTMGTAYWILPRFLKGPKRGDKKFAVTIVLLFNSGILILVFNNLFLSSSPIGLAGRFLQGIAVLIFTLIHWNRITTYRHED